MAFIYEDSTHNNVDSTWLSFGARPQYHFSQYTSLAFEAGVDQIDPENGSSRHLYKVSVAPQISGSRDFWSRPVLRLFLTYAKWNQNAEDAGINPNNIYNNNEGVSYGLQAEAWW